MLLCPDCNAKMQNNLVVVFLSALFETGRMIFSNNIPLCSDDLEFSILNILNEFTITNHLVLATNVKLNCYVIFE